MAKKSTFVSWAEYIPVWIFVVFVQNTPRIIARWAGHALGLLLWLLLNVQRKRLAHMIDNIKNLYPDHPKHKLHKIAKDSCIHFITAFADYFRQPLITLENYKKLLILHGTEHLDNALSKGAGVIFATAHFGYWEICDGVLAMQGYPALTVVRTVDNPHIDNLFDNLRLNIGLGVIKRENAAKQIIQSLRQNKIVRIIYDQNTAFNHIFVPFFDKLASTTPAPALISLRTGAPIVPFFCVYDHKIGKYVATIHPAIEFTSTKNKSADVRQIMMKLNVALENAVKKTPEQWLWMHRRWKTRPTDQDIRAHEEELRLIKIANQSDNTEDNEAKLAR
ncbi:MAG TPA: lysophospholipid acyltransferase family protein [Nitrospinota bacterium]|nr:lysophospholipid acyltransferase family protein [Nitrospinota bacterium]|tara:strand:+ start:8534 stop:9535 length:1002 start_codon:yes stop_codon:yes gene_type:complete